MHLEELITILLFLGIITLVYVLEVSLVIRFLYSKFIKRKETNFYKSKLAFFVHFLAIGGIICFIYGYFVEPYWIKVNTINIISDKFKSTNIRIIQISDLHCEIKIRNENILPEIINSLNPDIIVFTGDALNEPQALSVFQDTLKAMKAKIGKYAVRGNFDIWYWKDLELFKNTGFQVLDKDYIEIEKQNETFFISGISPDYFDHFYDVLKNVPKNNFSIFLYHYSDWIEDLEDVNVDLYLSGHTHGGQVALPFYGALATLSKFGKKYESGYYKVKDVILYVNRGIGMEGGIIPRVRFWSRPEITIFDITPK